MVLHKLTHFAVARGEEPTFRVRGDGEATEGTYEQLTLWWDTAYALRMIDPNGCVFIVRRLSPERQRQRIADLAPGAFDQ